MESNLRSSRFLFQLREWPVKSMERRGGNHRNKGSIFLTSFALGKD